jgi:ribonucleoside-diphosphate reductase alpha chain
MEPHPVVSPTQRLEAAMTNLAQATPSAPPVMTKSELYKQRMSEAKLRGYEGTSCSECHNFTMVRNGTCLKCDTCGSTSGCS